MNRAARSWLFRVARWAANPVEAAELYYQALGGGRPW